MTTSPQGSTQSADDQAARNSETESGERREDVAVGIDDDADRARRDPDGIDRIAEAQTKQANP
jgi:hypothetical protein